MSANEIAVKVSGRTMTICVDGRSVSFGIRSAPCLAKMIKEKSRVRYTLEKVEAYRISNGLTYSDMSRLLGVSRSLINRWLVLKSPPGEAGAKRISAALSIPIDDLICGVKR